MLRAILDSIGGFLLSLLQPLLMAGMLLIPLIIVASSWWAGQEDANRLSHVAPAFKVRHVLASGEVNAGIGPGANETGLILYELPSDIAESIASEGSGWLEEIKVDEQRHDFSIWHETPLRFDAGWPSDLSAARPDVENASITDFMRQRWPVVDVTPELESEVNDLLHQAGNFYSYDGARMLIVAPSARRVAFAYSG